MEFKDLPDEQVKAFRKKIKASGIAVPVDHMPYLPNLASPKGEHYSRSVDTLKAELARAGQLGIPYLVTHLGHYHDEGIEGGYDGVIGAINKAFPAVKNDVMLLLETTAGEKNTVGGTFRGYTAYPGRDFRTEAGRGLLRYLPYLRRGI